jgi:hypothetical protein
MRNFITLLALFALTLAGSAFAQTLADDVINLAKKNAGEEVMIAFVEASHSAVKLSAADIMTLRDANVPDKVITALLRHRPAGGQPQESNSSSDATVVIDSRPAPSVVYTSPVVYDAYQPVVYSGYYPGYGYPGLYVGFGFGGYWGGYHGYRGGFHGRR